MDCDLPHVFDVRARRAPVADVRMLRAPFGPGIHALVGKDQYGDPMEHHVDGVNFTVQWEGDNATEAIASAYLDELERAWATLVLDQGWPQPASADKYLLWVILDPTLGATGYTTTYDTTEYPDGYPVMYVNPSWWQDYEDFSRSVAIHEFGHAIQYGVRDWTSTSSESWFWEASAEWMAELGNPALDTYAWSAPYYAEHTTYAYDSVSDAHHYGMFVLPAYIADNFQSAWEDNDGGDWADELADREGVAFDDLIGGMASAYVAGTLRESSLYESATPSGTFSGDRDVDVDEFGTAIFRATAPLELAVDGPARIDFAVDGAVLDAPPGSGDFYALVTRNDEGDIRLIEGTAPEEEEKDTAGRDRPEGGGCATVATPSVFSLLALAALRRRSPAR